MNRKHMTWVLILMAILPVLSACDVLGVAVELTPTATSQHPFDSPLRPLTVMADDLGSEGNEQPQISQPVSGGVQEVAEPSRAANLPVIIARDGGSGEPTVTPTGTIQPPTVTVTPSPSATADNTTTPTVTNTVDPNEPTATATTAATMTLTPSPSTTSMAPTKTPTATSTPKATATPTATATQGATPSPTATQSAQHFADCSSRTGSNATVAVRANSTISGNFIFEVNDEIAAFTPDGSICAGMALWTGENIAITAWGDDSQTSEVDGLRSGETMKFRVWDRSAGMEYQVTSTSYTMGNGVYTPDSIHVMNAMTVAAP